MRLSEIKKQQAFKICIELDLRINKLISKSSDSKLSSRVRKLSIIEAERLFEKMIKIGNRYEVSFIGSVDMQDKLRRDNFDIFE